MNILVVDDEQDVQPLFKQRFRKEIRSGQFDFTFVLSGHEALAYFEENGYQDKIVLSDINMPGMSGLELLENIQNASTPPPPIIFMISAYGDDENKNSAQELGAEDFFTKPLDFNLLKEKLNSLKS